MLFNNFPKVQSSDTGDSGMPKRSQKVFPVSKNVNVLNSIKKGKNYMLMGC
jgi:hypothetical protein